MKREEIERIMEEAARQRGSRHRFSTDRIRQVLNALFLLLALVGVVSYFAYDHRTGMAIVAAGMLLKIVEFILRFLF